MAKKVGRKFFLKQITEEYGSGKKSLSYEDDTYHLIGLPFYNKESESDFRKEFNKLTSE